MIEHQAGAARPARPPRRFAVVGTGHRAQMYLDALAGPHRRAGELVALVDPNRARAEYYRQRWSAARPGPDVPLYHPDELEAMVGATGATTVIVTSPDRCHADHLARALAAGCSVICEKPLTIDEEGCRRITTAAAESPQDVVLTFNYRYAPRNSVVKELLAEGAIGDVTSVHFEWVLDTVHGADYFRRWHREKANSGGLLVHKSSHHFDLVNWWLDDVPSTVQAEGSLAFYGEAGAARRGGDRPLRSHGAPGLGTDPFLIDLAADPRLRALYLEAEGEDGYLRDRDVFTPGITIEDTMAVLARYTRGALLTYSLTAYGPWEGYRVAFNGTEGRLELSVCERAETVPPIAAAAAGERFRVDPSAEPDAVRPGEAAPGRPVRIPGDRLVLQRHWEPAEELDIQALAGRDPLRPPRGGAHGGGDALLLDDVFAGPEVIGPDRLGRAAGYRDGARSALVGIAANRSMATGAAVDYTALAGRVGLGDGTPALLGDGGVLLRGGGSTG
jgi:predicted dehydrogenase